MSQLMPVSFICPAVDQFKLQAHDLNHRLNDQLTHDRLFTFRCNFIFLHGIQLGPFCVSYSFSVISEQTMPAEF
jgi:hypothetical protein